MKLNAKRVALGAALTTLSVLCVAHAATLPVSSPAAQPTAAKAPLTGKASKAKAGKVNAGKAKADKPKKSSSRAKPIPGRAQDLIGASAPHSIMGTLYAAVPGAVLELSDDMLSTAMDTPFELNPKRAVWGRMTWHAARPEVTTSAKLPGGSAISKTKIERRSFAAQFGMPVYSNGTTRIDATFGLGSHLTQANRAGKRDPELMTYQAALGANLLHRAQGEVDLRLGTQLFGGSSELKGGKNAANRPFEQKFRHMGLSVRGEVSRDFHVGGGFVVTPLVGLGATTAWVKPRDGSRNANTSASTWVAARMAYNHGTQSGRTASFWVEPTYINQFKRSTTSPLQFADVKLDVTSRLPRDRVGARIGMDLPVGKQGAFQASLSQFWTTESSRQKSGALQLGYTQRF